MINKNRTEKLNKWQKLVKIFVTFLIAFAVTFCGWNKMTAIAALTPDPTICPADRTISPLEKELREALGDQSLNTTNILTFSNKLLTYEGCPEEMGAWVMLPMPKKEADRMQAVHSIVLPDNQVLIFNGSSNRNRLEPTDKDPNGEILPDEIVKNGVVYKLFDGVNITTQDGYDEDDYNAVNNTSIFNPSLSDPYYKNDGSEKDFDTVPFTRIASPDAIVDGESNDLFCSGHLHLPNGDVLVIGGTRFYYPGVQFQGSKQANLFHWDTKTWEELGVLPDGHWYPTLVPLEDGSIAAFSGLSAGVFNKISPIVEIYNPNETDESKKWQHLDISNVPNSPFTQGMNDQVFTKDLIDLYPRILPTKDGRFLITGDGGGKTPLVVHKSVHSYFAKFDKDAEGNYSIEFQLGPDRKEVSKVYGTASIDPNSENGDILLYGGIIGTNDISFGAGKYAIRGASITASVERWVAPDPETDPDGLGYWTIDEEFLAKIDEDILQNSSSNYADPQYEYVKQSSNLGRYGKRAMENAVLLPNKDILVINGGNYAENLPNYFPTLLTADPDKDSTQADQHLGFHTKTLNPDNQPRLYHNNALLLPDARVLVLGGNNSRAARYVDDGEVEVNTYHDFNFVPKGYTANSGEIYQHSIFYPPYLFTQGARPEIETDIDTISYGETETITVSNSSGDGTDDSMVLIKLPSVTHSFDRGQRFVELEKSYDGAGVISFTVPTDRFYSPPGYYMLFYVNAEGTPSHAKIVSLS